MSADRIAQVVAEIKAKENQIKDKEDEIKNLMPKVLSALELNTNPNLIALLSGLMNDLRVSLNDLRVSSNDLRVSLNELRVKKLTISFNKQDYAICLYPNEDLLPKSIQAFGARKRNEDVTHFRFYKENIVVRFYGDVADGDILEFRAEQKLIPISACHWSPQQLDLLRIEFKRDDSISDEFISFPVQMSDEALLLVDSLKNLNHNVVKDFEQGKEDIEIADIVLKCVYVMKKYSEFESSVHNFVTHLLNRLNFNKGRLFVFPEFEMPLVFNETYKAAKPDHIVLDLVSFFRLCVFEDKRVANEELLLNSEPQMIAELIAMFQQNLKLSKKNCESKNFYDEFAATNGLYAVRVTGCKFSFYYLDSPRAILQSMNTCIAAAEETIVKVYPRELDFLNSDDRLLVIKILDALRTQFEFQGKQAVRRESHPKSKIVREY